jgi:hypothetical protein
LTEIIDPGNQVSFIACFEKTENMGTVARNKTEDLAHV